MFELFRSKPLLDPDTTQWFFDTYAWALRNFGSDIFHEDTLLVTPTDQHFPDKAAAADELAAKILGRIQGYCAMQNWPCQPLAVSPEAGPVTLPPLQFSGAPRGPACTVSIAAGQHIPVPYDPGQIKMPDQLISTFAQHLAHLLSRTTAEAPPGGEDYRTHATDVLAIFMGFGLFLANTAFTVCKGSCGGCGTTVQTLGSLTEDQATYALAIHAVLKNIPDREISAHLKSTLRPFYKKATKEIAGNTAQIERLRAISNPVKRWEPGNEAAVSR